MLPTDISISNRFSIEISLGSVIMDSKDTTTIFVHFNPMLALTFQIIKLTFTDTFLTRAKVFFLYVIMLFQKIQWYFLLNSMLHNNSHFISLYYVENSLGLHYFSLLYVGVKQEILIIIYLKRNVEVFQWLMFIQKKTWNNSWTIRKTHQWMVLCQTLKTPHSCTQVTWGWSADK